MRNQKPLLVSKLHAAVLLKGWHSFYLIDPTPKHKQTRTVARKSSMGALRWFRGDWHSKFDKNSPIHSASHFNLKRFEALFGEAKPSKASPWRRYWNKHVQWVRAATLIATFSRAATTASQLTRWCTISSWSQIRPVKSFYPAAKIFWQ